MIKYTDTQLSINYHASANRAVEALKGNEFKSDKEYMVAYKEMIDFMLKEYFDWREEYAKNDKTPPVEKRVCPKCGKDVIRKTGTGPKGEYDFWSCTGWKPNKAGCDHTEPNDEEVAKAKKAEADDSNMADLLQRNK